MPWGTVRRSAPGPGPLPAAADANLSAETEGAAERGLRRQHSLRGLIKGKLRIRREGSEQARKGWPLRGALPRQARGTHAGPPRCPPPPAPESAHPRAGPRDGTGRDDTRAAGWARRLESGGRGAAPAPRVLPLPPTHFRGGGSGERTPAPRRNGGFPCAGRCRD